MKNLDWLMKKRSCKEYLDLKKESDLLGKSCRKVGINFSLIILK